MWVIIISFKVGLLNFSPCSWYLFLLVFFLITGIIPLYAIYWWKIYFYPINFGFVILNQDRRIGCNLFLFYILYLFS